MSFGSSLAARDALVNANTANRIDSIIYVEKVGNITMYVCCEVQVIYNQEQYVSNAASFTSLELYVTLASRKHRKGLGFRVSEVELIV